MIWYKEMVDIMGIFGEDNLEARVERLESALIALLGGRPELAIAILGLEDDDDGRQTVDLHPGDR